LVAGDVENWLLDPRRRPLVMGVLNVTPDSFSDGGKFAAPQAAIDHAMGMIAAGADLIDIGGESTRPGALPVAAEEQIRRVLPVIEGIRRKSGIVISIDTTRWAVAEAALAAGANMVNDISAGRDDPAMLGGVAAREAPIILMHMRGEPRNMQANPAYADVTGEVIGFLRQRQSAAESAGIQPHRILLDPGVGFGKSADHSLTLLRDLGHLAAIGRPLVVGASRKSFIGRVLGEPEPTRRIFGDAAVISWSVANRAAILRVHDVGATAQVVRATVAIRRGTVE
jgi:dihydropteroate synthase